MVKIYILSLITALRILTEIWGSQQPSYNLQQLRRSTDSLRNLSHRLYFIDSVGWVYHICMNGSILYTCLVKDRINSQAWTNMRRQCRLNPHQLKQCTTVLQEKSFNVPAFSYCVSNINLRTSRIRDNITPSQVCYLSSLFTPCNIGPASVLSRHRLSSPRRDAQPIQNSWILSDGIIDNLWNPSKVKIYPCCFVILSKSERLKDWLLPSSPRTLFTLHLLSHEWRS
jgi:hypothetical protein